MSTAGKQMELAQPGFFGQMLQPWLYKPNQGKIVRQVTFAALAILMLVASWELSRLDLIARMFQRADLVFLTIFSIISLWIAYRLVNYARFADFLIAVEAELNKVSWPNRRELWRAAVVVMVVMFLMAAVLFVYDIFWTWLFSQIGIRFRG